MANVIAMTGKPSINASNDPELRNWNTGDTLVTPDGNVIMVGTPSSAELAIPDGDATPDISGGENFKTVNTVLTTITNFINGVAGTRIRVRITDTNTIISGTLTKTGRTIVCLVGDVFEWVYDGASWIQVGGNVGMGAYIRYQTPIDVTAGTWIGNTVIVYTTIPMASWLPRLGVDMVHVSCKVNASAGTPTLLARAVGDTDNTLARVVANYTTGFFGGEDFFVKLNDAGNFEARWWTAFTPAGWNNLYLEGITL